MSAGGSAFNPDGTAAAHYAGNPDTKSLAHANISAMLDGAVIIWGSHYRPDEFKASLAGDGATVSVAVSCANRVGPVVISRSASTPKQAFVWNSGVSGGLRPVVPSRPHVTAEPRD